MTPAWIGLGANLGDPLRQLQSALLALAGLPHSELKAWSPSYWTAPWGGLDQPDFLNAVACVHTTLDAHTLLQHLLHIEAQLGRRRDGPQWGPRQLDLDLLLYGNQCIASETLQVPHPHLRQRAFVLQPLSDLAADLGLPNPDGSEPVTVQDCLDALDPDELDTLRPGPSLQPR